MKILFYFWPPAETYCQNMVILGGRKIKPQNPLYFWVGQVSKFHPQKIK
jgi:hypothetical protein